MPAPRMLDFGSEATNLEKVLSGFSDRSREQQVENRENDALSAIYRDYKKEGKQLDDVLMDIQTKSGISPSKRVSAAAELLQMKKINSDLQSKQLKTERDAAKQQYKIDRDNKKLESERADVAATVDVLDFDPATKTNLKNNASPATARALANVQKKDRDVDYKIAANKHEINAPDIKHYAESAIQAKNLIPALDAAIINNDKYGKGEKSWDTIVDASGSKWLQQFKSKTGQKLEAVIPIAIGEFAPKMGGVLTNNKLNIIEKKAVGLGRDPGANRMLLYMDKFNNELNVLINKTTKQILSENEFGLSDSNFQQELDKRMYPYRKMVDADLSKLVADQKPTSPMSHNSLDRSNRTYKMRTPEGEVLDIDYKMIPEAISDGLEYVE